MIKIKHDDSPLDIVDKINAALSAYGIGLVDDGKKHDGYYIFKLKELQGDDDE